VGIGSCVGPSLACFGSGGLAVYEALIAEEEWGAAADAACAAIRKQSRPGGCDRDALRRGYDQGHIRVWSFWLAGKRVGTTIMGVDDYPDGAALVVHVAHGRGDSGKLSEILLPAIEQIAMERGCRWVKFETVRAGLKEKAAAMGYDQRSVFVREIDNGR